MSTGLVSRAMYIGQVHYSWIQLLQATERRERQRSRSSIIKGMFELLLL